MTLNLRDPLAIGNYARQHLIEQLMVLVGCEQPCGPVAYRRRLEGMTLKELRAEMDRAELPSTWEAA